MIYNPLDKFFKSNVGAVPEQEETTFRVKGNFDSVVFAFKKDGEEKFNFYSMTKVDSYFEIKLKFNVGLYFYFFKIDSGEFISQNKLIFGEIMSNIIPFQLTVYKKEYVVPNWFLGGIMYQIFPDRFNRSTANKQLPTGKVFHENWSDEPIYEPNKDGKILNNDFFGGDLQGIREKLGYLSELGVTVIYLNPIFKAYSNHRYDTGDYMQIDPVLGNEKDFIALIRDAESYGIKIVLDGVFNHTGDDSVYFNKYGNYDSVGAYQSKDSKYYDWYDFIDYPNEYDSWWGIKTLPSLNEKCDRYVDFITGANGVIEKYTNLGVGGWRLDVVDELPSEFVKKIRNSVKKSNENAVIIGEVWEDASNKISYGKRREYFQGEELDSVMNYPLKNAILSFVNGKGVSELISTIRLQIDHYPSAVLNSLMNILSTHDTMRLINALSGVDYKGMTKSQIAKIKSSDFDYFTTLFKVKAASLLQFTLCGVPCVYYGDEVGLDGGFDPLNRRTFPWGKENGELCNWYKKLAEIRRSYSAFSKGEFKEVYSSNGMFIFRRVDENCDILVAVNVGGENQELNFDGKVQNLLDEKVYDGAFQINPNSLAVLVKP